MNILHIKIRDTTSSAGFCIGHEMYLRLSTTFCLISRHSNYCIRSGNFFDMRCQLGAWVRGRKEHALVECVLKPKQSNLLLGPPVCFGLVGFGWVGLGCVGLGLHLLGANVKLSTASRNY